MEKLKEIHDWMSKEDGLTTPFDQFAARFKDNAQEQKGLYDYLKSKDMVEEGRTPEQFVGIYFGGVEPPKKKEETVGSPVSSVASKTATPATQNSGAVNFGDAPAVAVAPKAPVETPDDDLARLMEAPTEELLGNYINRVTGDQRASGSYFQQNAADKAAGKAWDVLPELEKIRKGSGTPQQKFLEAKRVLATATKNAAFEDDMAQSEATLEASDPEAYRGVIQGRLDKRIADSGGDKQTGMNALMKSSIPDVFPDKTDQYEAGLVVDRQRLMNRIERTPRMENQEAWNRFQAERKIELDDIDKKRNEARDVRLSNYQSQIEELNSIIVQLPEGGDRAEFMKERDGIKAQMDGYLNPAPKLAKVMAQFGDEINASEGKTPMEKARSYYAALQAESTDLKARVARQGSAEMFAEATISEQGPLAKRLTDIEARKKALAPIVFFNEAPRGAEAGLMTSFGSAFGKGMAGPTMGEMFVPQTDREAAIKSQEALAMAGINPESVNPEAMKATVAKAKEGDFFSGDYLGGVLGGSAAMMAKIYIGGKLLPTGKMNIFGGTKVLDIMNKAVKTGVEYEKGGIVFANDKDELNFVSGMLGGLGAGVVGTKKVKETTSKLLASVFGDKANAAANVIAAGFEKLGAGGGETVEEIGNTLGSILQSSDTFEQMQKKLGEQFPDLSSVGKFVATTMLMGAIMNGGADIGDAKPTAGDTMLFWAKKKYDEASPEDRAQVDQVLAQAGDDAVVMAENVQKAPWMKAQEEDASPVEPQAEEVVTEETLAPEVGVVEEAAVEAPVSEVSTETVVETPQEVAAASEAISGDSDFAGIEDALADIDLDDEAAVTEALTKTMPVAIETPVAAQETLAQQPSEIAKPKSIKQLAKENKTTAPKIPSSKVFLNDASPLSPEQRKGTDKIIDEKAEATLPIEKVSINDIVPTQKSVTIPNLEKVSKLKGEAEDPIVLIKRDGKYFVSDGHHRIANQILNGSTEIEARVSVEESAQEVQEQEVEAKQEVAATKKIVPAKKGAKTVGESGVFEEQTSLGRRTQWKKEEDGWYFRNYSPGGGKGKAMFTADWAKVSGKDAERIEEVAGMTKEQLDVRNAMADVSSKWKSMGKLSGLSSGADPRKVLDLLESVTKLGVALMKSGVVDSIEWTKAVKGVLDEKGIKIDKLLPKLYDKAKARLESETKPKEEAAPKAESIEPKAETKEVVKEEVKPASEPKGETKEEGKPKKRKRGFVKNLRKKGEMKEVSAKMSSESKMYVPRGKDVMAEDARRFIEENGPQGVMDAISTSDMKFDSKVTAGKELLKYYYKQSKEGTDAEKKAALRNAVKVAEKLSELGTMLGQGVNAYKGWADGMQFFGADFMLKYASDTVLKIGKKMLDSTKAYDDIARDAIEQGTKDAQRAAVASKVVDEAITQASESLKEQTVLGLNKAELAKRQSAALAKAKAAWGQIGKSAMSGANPAPLLDAVAALAEYGVYLAAEGVVDFKAFAAKMRKAVGDIDDDTMQQVWEAKFEGKSPREVGELSAAAKRLDAIINPKEKKEKATDPMRKVTQMVRERIAPRVKGGDKKTPTELLGEAVANAEKYADAWNAAVAQTEQAIDSGTGTDTEKAAQKTALRQAVDDVVGKPFTDEQVRRAVRSELKAMKTTISDVVKDVELASTTKDELASKLEDIAGLSPEQSAKVSEAVLGEFKSMVKAKRRQSIERALGPKGKAYFAMLDKMGEKDLTDQQWRDELKEKYNLPELSDAMAAKVQKMAEEAAAMPEGSHERAKKAVAIMAELNNIEGIDKGGLFWDIYYAKILSGPQTHARNILGGIYNAISESIISGIEQGWRNKDPMAIINSVTGFYNGMVNAGVAMSADIMRNGVASKGDKFENPGTLESIIKGRDRKKDVVSRAKDFGLDFAANLKYVSRALAAEDAFFYQGFRGMKLKEIAREEILKARRSGESVSTASIWKQVNDRVHGNEMLRKAAEEQVKAEATKFGLNKAQQAIRYNEIMESNLPSEWLDKADKFGAYGTYNYKPTGFLGSLSEAVSSFKEKEVWGAKAGRLLNFIIPFSRVPANIFNQQLSYSPWAFARLMSKSMSADFDLVTPDQRNRERLKGVIGTMLWTSVMAPLIADLLLGDNDDEDKDKNGPKFRLHGKGPANFEQRRMLEQSGWRPYSIQIGNAYFPYDNTAAALPLTMAANYKDMALYGDFSKKEAGEIAWQTIAATLGAASDRSFLSGLGDFFKIMSGDASGGQKLQSMLVKTVTPIPNFIPQVTEMFDPTKYKSEGFFGKFIEGVPFVRDWAGIKPDIDVFGKSMQKVGKGPLGAVGSLGNPDPVRDFINNNGLKVAKIGKATKIKKEDITDEQLYRLTELSGPLIYDAIKMSLPKLEKMDKEEAQEYIDDIRSLKIAESKKNL